MAIKIGQPTIKVEEPSNKSRQPSGSFPLEIPYRLINMFYVKGDTVLDPFIGTATTTLAAIASERNSIGIEIDDTLEETINERISTCPISDFQSLTENRLDLHCKFVESYLKPLRYFNDFHQFPVVTRSEQDIKLRFPHRLIGSDLEFTAHYDSDWNQSVNLASSNMTEIEPSLLSLEY